MFENYSVDVPTVVGRRDSEPSSFATLVGIGKEIRTSPDLVGDTQKYVSIAGLINS